MLLASFCVRIEFVDSLFSVCCLFFFFWFVSFIKNQDEIRSSACVCVCVSPPGGDDMSATPSSKRFTHVRRCSFFMHTHATQLLLGYLRCGLLLFTVTIMRITFIYSLTPCALLPLFFFKYDYYYYYYPARYCV